MDNQIVSLAGEYFVAAELLKRDFQVSITLGNAKSIDMMVRNETSKNTYNIQVKTLRRKPNCFDLHSQRIEANTIYIFVYLNSIDDSPEYFIVRGKELQDDLKHFYGASLGRKDKRETVNHGPLQKHIEKWGKLS